MKISPMNKSFILFRCIQFGLLGPSNIEKKIINVKGLTKEQLVRNKKYFTRLIDAYGSCAMLALDGGLVVGHARFYPQVICEKYQFCCQDPKNAITQDMVDTVLPAIENPEDRILRVNCFLVHKDYRGQGLTHLLIANIIEWAETHKWKIVRAYASPDDYKFSYCICAPMLRSYIKHGFRKIKTVRLSEMKELLPKIQSGELGIKRKKEFEKFSAGKNLSDLEIYYEVELQL